MQSEAGKRLADDHVAVGAVLKDLQRALNSGDCNASHAKLDLFWARLAVHIRAEHLHLFPTLLHALNDKTEVVEQLRRDHDFFMHELARAIMILRDLLHTADAAAIGPGLNTVREIVGEVEKRLARHNEFEENEVYRWASTVLTEPEQAQLARQIDSELANRPTRFSANSWLED